MFKLKHLIPLALTALFLAACASQATPPVTETLPAEETAVPTPTLLPRPSPVVDNCLECHTDKEKLTALAKEEEAGHGSESEGVG